MKDDAKLPPGPEAHPTEELPVRTIHPTVSVELEIVRAVSRQVLRVEVPRGSSIRDALRSAGRPPEGSAVLEGDRPLPLDHPILAPARYLVVPTFSGG